MVELKPLVTEKRIQVSAWQVRVAERGMEHSHPHCIQQSSTMHAVPSFISLLERLHAASSLVALASRILPQVSSAESAAVITAQIVALRREIREQIEVVEKSMEGFADRLETIAQFLLLNRERMDPADAAEVHRLLASVRG